jgi:hypothetical protein
MCRARQSSRIRPIRGRQISGAQGIASLVQALAPGDELPIWQSCLVHETQIWTNPVIDLRCEFSEAEKGSGLLHSPQPILITRRIYRLQGGSTTADTRSAAPNAAIPPAGSGAPAHVPNRSINAAGTLEITPRVATSANESDDDTSRSLHTRLPVISLSGGCI